MSPSHFFIIGGQRCATTWLWRALSAHPDIEMAHPMRPEPKYFLKVPAENQSQDSYSKAHYSGTTKVRGEKSTSYSESVPAVRNILAMFPKARFVMLIRDPIDRAISNVRFSRDNGLEQDTLEAALGRELDNADGSPAMVSGVSVSPFAYLARSDFLTAIARLQQVIPSGQLMTVQSEILTSDPAVLMSLCGFLGVDESRLPLPDFQPVNAAIGSEGDMASELGTELLSRLRTHFAPMLPRLVADHGVDLAKWTTTCPAEAI